MKLPHDRLSRFQWRLLCDYLGYLNSVRSDRCRKLARVRAITIAPAPSDRAQDWADRPGLKLED
jgi:hypothetical protein